MKHILTLALLKQIYRYENIGKCIALREKNNIIDNQLNRITERNQSDYPYGCPTLSLYGMEWIFIVYREKIQTYSQLISLEYNLFRQDN